MRHLALHETQQGYPWRVSMTQWPVPASSAPRPPGKRLSALCGRTWLCA
jgi:hypothetical protein